jgi:hypothetical protein
MPLGQLQRSPITIVVCDHRRLEHDDAADDLDDGECVRVAVWVDTDDLVQLICEHPNRPPARVLGGHEPVPVWGSKPRAAEL